MAFVQVRASRIRSALPRGFHANDGLGSFVLWIIYQAELLKINSHNYISIPNKKTAKELNISIRTLIQWKQELINSGLIIKLSGKSLFKINPDLIYKGKSLKT